MTTVNLQPDSTAGLDTYIRQGLATTNLGTQTDINVGLGSGGTSDKERILIQFDLSSIPTGAIITTATLRLYLSGDNGFPANQDVTIHRGLVAWVEAQSTWNNRITATAWTGGSGGVAGTEYNTTATATTAVGAQGADYDWNVAVDVQGFIDGTYTNNGWWLIGTATLADRLKAFSSSDHATAGQRPELIVVYTAADISGTFAGVAAFSGALTSTTISGEFAGVAAFSGALTSTTISGEFAGVAAFSGAMKADGFMAGAFAGVAALTGLMPVQEMAGSFAGVAAFTGGGRAVLLPRVPIWKAIVAGVEYSLSGGNPFHRLQTTGIGIANIRNIKQRGPYQDGSTRRDFRLDERFMNLVFLLQGATRAQADTYRDALIEIFKPLTNTPCQINVTRDDGVIKQIDAYAVGVLDFPETESERFAATQRVAVQLEAPNPIWYGPELQNLGFTSVLGGTAGFKIPIMIPWAQQVGEYINVTESFYYEGNWKEYPVIVITGPAIDAKITNLTTNEKIDFTGYTIAAGDTRTVDLRFGTKTVKNAAGVLKNNELTSDSNLGTFHLAPSPEATGGINDIQVEILSGGTTATRVSLQYYHRYIHL